jgi:hypothetical protein
MGHVNLFPRPHGSNVVTDKSLSDGTFDHYNACWVLQGFMQCPGVDYDETFSPIVKLVTMRTVLAIAASHN